MKKNRINIVSTIVLIALLPGIGFAQDSAKKELLLSVAYHMQANKVPQLLVNAKTKVEKRFLPVKNINVAVYLGADSASNLIGKVSTNENGEARLAIPASFKSVWDGSASHSFLGISEPTKEFDITKSELTVRKAKVLIDTVEDAETRSLAITVLQLMDSEWMPAKDVEVKVGVNRLGGVLPVGEEESYTTDSTGKAIAEFKRDSLPGDAKGNLQIVARVEENEELGSLTAVSTVPWGVLVKDVNHFNERSLWATRDKAPVWLLFMAGSIMIGVWSVLVYLFFMIYRLRTSAKKELT